MSDSSDNNLELKRKIHELAMLRAMAEQVTTTLELDVVLERILVRMHESFGFEHSMILLPEPSGTELRLVKSHGYARADVGDNGGVGAIVKVGQGVAGIVAKHKKLMRIGGLRTQRRYAAAVAVDAKVVKLPGLPDLESTVAVPLLARGKLIGVFVVESDQPSCYDDADRELVETLAFFAAVAIHNSLLYMAEQAGRAEMAALAKAGSRFVPHEFLLMLGRDKLTEVQRGDHVEKEMSILFSDIRSFTTLVEGRTPQQNFAFINEYFSFMEPPIRENRGFIDSFEGDAIMALFANHEADAAGSAVAVPVTSADAAVAAAVGDLRALEVLNVHRVARGDPPLRIGVGINTGHLMLGTIGANERIKCGVIGDPVNLAARIEGMTKMYGAALLISEHTRARLSDPGRYAMRLVDRVRVKGKTAPVTVYEVLDGLPEANRARRAQALPTFVAAWDAYVQGHFDQAADAFRAVLRLDPDDAGSALHLSRCEHFGQERPAQWDGVYDLKSK